MLISATLSCVIAYFIIKLYVMRIRGQKPNLTKKQLRMETMEGKSSPTSSIYQSSPDGSLVLSSYVPFAWYFHLIYFFRIYGRRI